MRVCALSSSIKTHTTLDDKCVIEIL